MWDYPVGTEVVHVIYLKSADEPTFELRLMKKMKEKAGPLEFTLPRMENFTFSLIQELFPMHSPLIQLTTEKSMSSSSISHLTPVRIVISTPRCHLNSTSTEMKQVLVSSHQITVTFTTPGFRNTSKLTG